MLAFLRGWVAQLVEVSVGLGFSDTKSKWTLLHDLVLYSTTYTLELLGWDIVGDIRFRHT